MRVGSERSGSTAVWVDGSETTRGRNLKAGRWAGAARMSGQVWEVWRRQGEGLGRAKCVKGVAGGRRPWEWEDTAKRASVWGDRDPFAAARTEDIKLTKSIKLKQNRR